jgi:hypothetical protein
VFWAAKPGTALFCVVPPFNDERMDTEPGQVTDGDITIDSNHETVEQIETAFQDDPPPAVDATAVEAVEAVEDTPAPVKKRSRRNDPAEAVKSAVAKQREAERRAVAAESRVQELAQAVPPPAAAPPAPAQEEAPSWSRFKQMPGVPTVDQFSAYEDYSMALAEFVADAKQGEQRAAHEQRQVAQQQQVQLDRWSQTLNNAREANPAFDESLNLDTPMSLPMQHLAMESEQGVKILQWLSAHQNDAQRISTLHPAEQYREFGKLEARIELDAVSSTSSGSARVVSSAKAPIKPLGTSPPVEDPFEITEDLSMDEHFRRMNAADRQSGRL